MTNAELMHETRIFIITQIRDGAKLDNQVCHSSFDHSFVHSGMRASSFPVIVPAAWLFRFPAAA